MLDRLFLTVGAVLGVWAALPNIAVAQSTDDGSLSRLSFPMPAIEYPQEALVANQEGTAVLRLTIVVPMGQW